MFPPFSPTQCTQQKANVVDVHQTSLGIPRKYILYFWKYWNTFSISQKPLCEGGRQGIRGCQLTKAAALTGNGCHGKGLQHAGEAPWSSDHYSWAGDSGVWGGARQRAWRGWLAAAVQSSTCSALLSTQVTLVLLWIPSGTGNAAFSLLLIPFLAVFLILPRRRHLSNSC